MCETLKSRNGYQSFEWTEQILDDAAHGKVLIYRMGRRVPHKLSSQQWVEFDDAKRRGYVICRDVRANQSLLNVWFIWCELHGRPYVKVLPRKDYASVQMDLIAVPYKLGEEQKALLQRRVDELRHPSLWWRSGVSGCISHVYKALTPDAYKLAEMMLVLALCAREDTAGKHEGSNARNPTASASDRADNKPATGVPI